MKNSGRSKATVSGWMRLVRSRQTIPRGIAVPITNAPKTACSPTMSVNHAPSAISASPITSPASVRCPSRESSPLNRASSGRTTSSANAT